MLLLDNICDVDRFTIIVYSVKLSKLWARSAQYVNVGDRYTNASRHYPLPYNTAPLFILGWPHLLRPQQRTWLVYLNFTFRDLYTVVETFSRNNDTISRNNPSSRSVSMALQILSDLHLEAPKGYDIFDVIPKAPYLALIGDIGNVVLHKDDFAAFLRRQLGQFRAVLFVPGNHEAYHSDWPTTLQHLRTFEQDVNKETSMGKFVLLDCATFEFPDINVTVLGCSLFSSIPPEKEQAVSFGLNDFFHIDDWTVQAHNESHMRDVACLNAQVAALEEKDTTVVILTHWSPSTDARSVDPRHTASPISSGFSTDLSSQPCFQNKKVKVWAFGHTHYNCDFEAEREGDAEPLRLLTNQRGYYFAQAKGLNGEKVIDL